MNGPATRSGQWDLMIGIWDQKWVRVEVAGHWVDIEMPEHMWKTKQTSQVDKTGYNHQVTDIWKMCAVTFIRAKEVP